MGVAAWKPLHNRAKQHDAGRPKRTIAVQDRRRSFCCGIALRRSMSFYSTPRSTVMPSAPYPTPSSVLTRPKVPKAPIHNPYDKFTKPEFDDWIGDITSTLRKALGYEDEPQQNTPAPPHFDNVPTRVVDPESDYELDDSFAEVKARRAISKGKSRDPREGPGLGAGSASEPIDLLDSDDEDEEEDEEVEEEEEAEEDALSEERSPFGEEYEYEEQEEETEGDVAWSGAGASAEVDEDLEDDASIQEEQQGSDDVIEINSDSEDDSEVTQSRQQELLQDSEDYESDYSQEDEEVATAHLIREGAETIVTYADSQYRREGEDEFDDEEQEQPSDEDTGKEFHFCILLNSNLLTL